MQKIDDIWSRINALVPEPDCTTRGGKIIKWKDKRKRPTEAELLAVDLDDLPAPVNPLLQEFDGAKTVAEIKAALRKILFPGA